MRQNEEHVLAGDRNVGGRRRGDGKGLAAGREIEDDKALVEVQSVRRRTRADQNDSVDAGDSREADLACAIVR